MTEAAEVFRHMPHPTSRENAMHMMYDLYAFIFSSGMNHITDGARGGGKTHHGVAVAQMLLENPKGPWGRVVLLTNIIFQRKTEEGLERGEPPNVYRATTLDGILRQIGAILKRYGRDVRILIILDEAQNFMLSDLNSDKVNLALVRLFGIMRKFNAIVWLISPTIKNFVPRVRNFVTDDEPGYMDVRWAKDLGRARAAIDRHRMDAEPRDFTTIQYRGEDVHMIPIPPSTWTRRPEDIDVGDYCYDQLSSADLSMGENFELKPFIATISDVESQHMADTIIRYFEDLDNAAEDDDSVSVERLIIRDRMQTSDVLKTYGLSGAKIAAAVRMSETTWRRYYKMHLKAKGEEDVA